MSRDEYIAAIARVIVWMIQGVAMAVGALVVAKLFGVV